MSNKNRIVAILQKPYEYRNHHENQFIKQFVAVHKQLSHPIKNKLGLYLKYQSIQELCYMPSDDNRIYFRLGQEKTQQNPENQMECSISQKEMELLNGIVGESWQQQIFFWQGLGNLKQIGKKKLFNIFRHLEILSYTFNQTVLVPENNEDIYIARQGTFSFYYSPSPSSLPIEIYSFHQGHLFRSLERDSGLNENEKTSATNNQSSLHLKCRSSKGVIYRLSRQFYDNFLSKYTEDYLRNMQNKVSSFLRSRIQYIWQHSNTRIPNLSTNNNASNQRQPMLSQNKSSPSKNPTIQPNTLQRSLSYKSLQRSKISRNRLYSRSQIIDKLSNPTENDSERLAWKKCKSIRLRELIGSKLAVTKQQLSVFLKVKAKATFLELKMAGIDAVRQWKNQE